MDLELVNLKVDSDEVVVATRNVEEFNRQVNNTAKVDKAIIKASEALKILRGEAVNASDAAVKLGDKFTSSQSKVLSALKMQGATVTQLKEIAKVFEQLNKISGMNAFDKTGNPLSIIKQQREELEKSQRIAQKYNDLTKEQISLLTRGVELTRQKAKSEGLNFGERESEVKKFTAAFLAEAEAYNTQKRLIEDNNRLAKQAREEEEAKLNATKKAIEAKQQEKIAIEAATKAEEERRLVIMRKETWKDYGSNVGTKSPELVAMSDYYRQKEELAAHSTANLVKIQAEGNRQLIAEQNNLIKEMNQRKSMWKDLYGEDDKIAKQQEKAAARSAAVSSAMQKHTAEADKMYKSVNHLSRAISVQLGDVAVSLASGMNPFMVMIQQGDQIRGAVEMAKEQGVELDKAMSGALKSMGTSFLNTGKIIGNFVKDSVKTLGTTIVELPLKFTGLATSIEELNLALAISADNGSKVAAFWQRALPTIIGVTGAITALAMAFGAGLLIAYYKVSQENDKLVQQLTNTGGSLGLTRDAAYNAASAMGEFGVSTSKGIEAIQAMAKEGGFFASEIQTVGVSAANMAEYLGISIEDAVKQYAKLKKDPVEALFELAINTGKVKSETILLVSSLEEQGKHLEAISVATKTFADIQVEQIARVREEYSSWYTVMKAISEMPTKLGNVFKDLARGPTELEKTGSEIVTLKAKLGNVWIGDEKRNALNEQLKIAVSRYEAIQRLEAENGRLAQQEVESKQNLNWYLKEKEKMMSKQQKMQQEITQAENRLKPQVLSGTISQAAYDDFIKNIKDKYKETQKLSVEERYYNQIMDQAADYNEKLTGKIEKRTQAEIMLAQIKNDKKYASLTPQEKANFEEAMQKAKTVELQQNYNAALELEEKLLGKSSGKGKEYAEALKQIDIWTSQGIFNDEKGIALKANLLTLLEKTTPAYKSVEEAIKSLKDTQEDYHRSIQETITDLEMQQQVMFLPEAEQKRQLAYLKAEAKYREQIAKINQKIAGTKLLELSADQQEQFLKEIADLKARAEQDKVLAMSVVDIEQSIEDIKKIRDGLSNALMAAFMDGGKAGVNKLKDYLKQVLQERIQIQVYAKVDAVMNSKAGSTAGNLISKGIDAYAQYKSFDYASSVASATDFIGNSSLSVFNAGFEKLGTSMANLADWMGKNSGALESGLGYFSAFTSAMNGDYGSAIGAAIGTAIMPGIGTAIGSYLGSFANGLFGGGGDPRYKFLTNSSSTPSKKVFEDNVYVAGAYGNVGMADYSKNIQASKFTETFKAIAGLDDTIASTLDATTNEKIKKALNNYTSTKDSTVAAYVKGRLEIITNIIGGAVDSLADKFVGTAEEFATYVVKLTQVTKLFPVFEALWNTFDKTTEAAFKFSMALTDSLGGLDNTTAALQSYYENFYSDAEKAANLTKSLTELFASFNLALPTTKEGFRSLVETAASAGDSTLVAKLLASQGAVLTLFNLMDSSVSDLKNSWQDLTDSLYDEIKRIKGELAVGGSQGMAYYQSQFAIATAQARAGDQEAAKALPELSQAIQELAKNSVGSYAEYASIQASLVASLGATASLLGNQYGLSVPQFAEGGSYTGGLALVGETGPELINFSQPGQVYTANQTSSILSGGNTDMITELQALREEVTYLRAEVRADVIVNSKTAKLLDRVIPDGQSVQTTAV
jgi:phage-related minor tail protein